MQKFDYQITGSYYFSENDEKKILKYIKKENMTLEQAVREWRDNLDDIEYPEAIRVIDQIINYMQTKI